MTELNALVRKNIRELVAYSSARDEFSGSEGIFLDANENPFGGLNRYPDPYQRKLKSALALRWGVSTENLFVGNGSDEVIDLLFRVYCEPGSERALSFTPTYGMYRVSAAINGVELMELPRDASFSIDIGVTRGPIADPRTKLVFVCSPNNPTGNTAPVAQVRTLLEQSRGIVVVDEAYIDFAPEKSVLALLEKYPNLVVMRTLSKAHGAAALRIGAAIANPEIIAVLNKVKPPYNVSTLNQTAALQVLESEAEYRDRLDTLTAERRRMAEALQDLACVQRVYPSDANFLLVEFNNANEWYKRLVAQQIITRNRHSEVANCIRITIGTPDENDALLRALKPH